MAIPAAIYIILQPFLAAAVGTVIVRSLARAQRTRPAAG
jgi:hypothetical protein